VSVNFPADLRAEMESACVSYNSKLAAYFLLLTSSRFASFIQEVNADDLLRVPLPRSGALLKGIIAPADTDEVVRRAFGLKAAEWMLVEDAFAHTLSVFQAANPAKQRRSPADEAATEAPLTQAVVGSQMLEEYGDAFAKVIRAGFGADKRVRTTIFRTPPEISAPVHLLAVHLGWPEGAGFQYEDVTTEILLSRIVQLSLALEQKSPDGMTLRRRVARVYDTVTVGRQKIPTVYLCKPNLPRYWTRSMAMRDADEVSADLVLLANTSRVAKGVKSA